MLKSSFLSLMILSSCAHAALDPTLEARIRQVITPQIGTRVNSAVVGIYDHGEISYLTFGEARTDSVVEIGSLTKTVTSLLFAIAIEKGLVTPETVLSEIRPEWKNQRLGSVTLLELATHRSGLMRLPCNLSYEDEANPYKDYSEKDLIESITDASIDSIPECKITPHPTESLNYSNWGAALLGNAIGTRAKMSYQEILKAWITDPMGMKDTVVNLNPEQKSRLLQGYSEEMKPAGLWDRQALLGNGALKSTAKDMMIYAGMMLHPELFAYPEAIRRVQKRQFNDIAYNWFITPAGSIWHNGITGGYSALMKVYLKRDFAIFDLTNSENELHCLISATEEESCDPLK